MQRAALVLTAAMAAAPAAAFDPSSLPGTATLTHDDTEGPASLSLPVGTYDGTLPMLEVEGRLHRRAWRLASANLSTLSIMRGLREDLKAGGYEVLLDCQTEACGGFDFRFGLTVLPAPEMNVDLFDFRVATAQRTAAGRTEFVYLLVSKGRTNRYVQIFDIVADKAVVAATEAPPLVTPPVLVPAPESPVPSEPTLITELRETGYVVLSDLDFASGAGGLSDRSYATLEALADYLKGNAKRVVLVVGHTDAVGTLEANIALSRQRAQAVRERLISRYDVPAAQVVAQGAGYLSPVASNLTQDGREANRRVEAVLLSAE